MLKVVINRGERVVTLQPEGALSKQDFSDAASEIDPFIASVDKLNGVIIYTPKFPGWDSLDAMVNHFKFLKSHRDRVAKIALVTDSSVAAIGKKLAARLTSAEIRHFDYKDLVNAQHWLIYADAES